MGLSSGNDLHLGVALANQVPCSLIGPAGPEGETSWGWLEEIQFVANLQIILKRY